MRDFVQEAKITIGAGLIGVIAITGGVIFQERASLRTLPTELVIESPPVDSTEDYGTLLPPRLTVDTVLADQKTGKCVAIYVPHHPATGKDAFRICGGANMPKAKRYVLAGTTFEQITLVPEIFVGK